jgi:hypothetical protein
MGVGGPSNFVTIVNRFPTHGQLLANLSNDRFVTIFGRNLVGAFHRRARLFRLQAVQRIGNPTRDPKRQKSGFLEFQTWR